MINTFYSTLLAQGISEETVAFAQSSLPGTVEIEGSMNLSGYIIGILLVMMTFFAVYYYGYGVSMSVATEKTTRVMETLIVSAKPSRILFGKCLGMGVLGLAQFAAIFLFGTVCFKVMIPSDFLLGGMPITLDAFTVRSAVLVVVFFILGYALYAMLNAVCGASVSKIEDLNSAMMPVMLVSMVSFYVAYFSMLAASADSMIQKVALYVPFTSPFIMPFKLLNSDVATMDICISIALLVISIVLVSAVCVRLYSASVLHYGKRLKWKELYKSSKERRDCMPLNNRLKEHRARIGVNQQELGSMVGASRQTISLIERGDYSPSVTLALKIAKIFGVPVEAVFSYEEEQNE